jgi:hypothetical protein
VVKAKRVAFLGAFQAAYLALVGPGPTRQGFSSSLDSVSVGVADPANDLPAMLAVTNSVLEPPAFFPFYVRQLKNWHMDSIPHNRTVCRTMARWLGVLFVCK